MTEYRTYFKIALYPKGIKGCYMDEDCEFIVDYDVQRKYLCNSEQSTHVLKYLTNEYKTSVYGEYSISDLQYLGKGGFSCLIKFNNEDCIEHDELEELITSLIWPGDYHDNVFIKINNEKLELDIELETYIEETDVDEEEIYDSEETSHDESEEYADDESEEIDEPKDSDEETEIDDAKDSEYFPSESGEDDEIYSDSETEESSNDTDVENDYIDEEEDKIFCKNYENDDEYIPSHYNKQIDTEYDNNYDTIYDNNCHTVYDNNCDTDSDNNCDTDSDNNCDTDSDNEISSNDYITNDYLTNCKPNLYLLFACAIYIYLYLVFTYYINDL